MSIDWSARFNDCCNYNAAVKYFFDLEGGKMKRVFVLGTLTVAMLACSGKTVDSEAEDPSTNECGRASSHPTDCSKVWKFQCGFSAQCNAGKVTITWHEHRLCGDQERIDSYGCKYDCPEACTTEELWGLTGDALVAAMCVSSDAGTHGSSDASKDDSDGK